MTSNLNPVTAPALVSTTSGRTLRAFGEEVVLHLEGKHTGGKLTMWTEITPLGGGPPPHYHTNEDEWFLVQEGPVSFLIDGQWRQVNAGEVVFIPRHTVHTFKNVGASASRMLLQTAPSGFEVFFESCAVEFQKPGGPDMSVIIKISAEHGIHFVSEKTDHSPTA